MNLFAKHINFNLRFLDLYNVVPAEHNNFIQDFNLRFLDLYNAVPAEHNNFIQDLIKILYITLGEIYYQVLHDL
jgi:hypothetical protein